MRAPWLETPFEVDLATDSMGSPRGVESLGPIEVVDAAYGAALVVTSLGAFVADERDGVTGPYALGEIADAAFTADRTLYVAGTDGTLLRAAYEPGVGVGAPTRLVGLSGATVLFGGTKLVAALRAGTVHVSTDRGESFRAIAREPDERVERFLTREDDTLIVQTIGPRGLVTRISTDLGATLHETIRVPPLSKLGDVVHGVDPSCASSPTWTFLSTTGTFVSASDPPTPTFERRVEDLSRWFVASPTGAEGWNGPLPWASDLRAPSASLPAYAGFPVCDPPTGHLHPRRSVKTVTFPERPSSSTESATCAGVACLRAMRSAPRPPTTTRAYLLHDGPRHALFVTARPPVEPEVRAVALPEGCAARFVTFSSGLVVLSCGSSIYAAARDGGWAKEWTADPGHPFSIDDFEMSPDGTAMFAHYGPDAARAIVRPPVAIGATSWREVTREGAVDYLLRDDGVVEVVLGEDDVLTVIEDAPSRAPREVLRRVRVGGDLWCLGHAGGRWVGVRRSPTGTFDRIVLTANRVDVDGPALDGSGATDPSGACGF